MHKCTPHTITNKCHVMSIVLQIDRSCRFVFALPEAKIDSDKIAILIDCCSFNLCQCFAYYRLRYYEEKKYDVCGDVPASRAVNNLYIL